MHNHGHFIERDSQVKLDVDDKMVSFDVVSFFTSLPVPPVVTAACEALEKDTVASRTILSLDELCRLLELFLGRTYFSVKCELFRQTSSTALDASISFTAANLNEKIEQRALRPFANSPKLYMRHVDVCLCILPKSNVSNFLVHLSYIEPSIQFTVECKRYGTLLFLDGLVQS